MAEEAFCPVPVTLRWWKSLREGETIQSELIKRVHDEMAHPSISQAMATLGRYFEISDCRSECLALSAECSICQKKQARLPKEFPNFAMSQAVSFGDTLQMDSVVIDQQYYYSIVDTASRFAYLFPSRDRPTGIQTREVLSAWVAFTGVLPRIIRADNGPEFAVYLSQWADERGVLVRHGAVANPRAQAIVERFHRSLITLIRCGDSSQALQERVFSALQVYNLRPHAHFKYKASPLEVKEKLRMRGWDQLDFGTEDVPDDELFIDEANRVLDDETEAATNEGHQRFEVGDSVLWRDPNSRLKSQFPWKAGEVVEKYGRGGVKVRFDEGAKRERVLNSRLLSIKSDNPITDTNDSADETEEREGDSSELPMSPRRSQRTRRAPNRYGFED
jgi:hypothetical protein